MKYEDMELQEIVIIEMLMQHDMMLMGRDDIIRMTKI
jgi:hypothetical protein